MDSINNKRWIAAGFGLGLALLLASCGGPQNDVPTTSARGSEDDSNHAPPPIEIRTTSFPVDYLVRRLSPDSVRAQLIMPAGEDPPHWRPTAEIVASLALPEVNWIVANGADYEAWMTTVSLPESRVLRSADGLDLLELAGRTHSHGGESEHSHVGEDPHTWTDPMLFLQQARNIHRGLLLASGADQGQLDARLGDLSADLEALDRQYAEAFAALTGQVRWAQTHPSYNYLAHRYGIEIRTFDLDPTNAAPSPHGLTAWAAQDGPPSVLLWEVEPQPGVVEGLPSSLRHIVLDPLEQPSASGEYDYLEQARANLRTLEGLTVAKEG